MECGSPTRPTPLLHQDAVMFSPCFAICPPPAETLEHCLKQMYLLLSLPTGQQVPKNSYRKYLRIKSMLVSASVNLALPYQKSQLEHTVMDSSITAFDSACFLLFPLNDAPRSC